MSGMATRCDTAREPALETAKPLFSYRPYWAHRFGAARIALFVRYERRKLGDAGKRLRVAAAQREIGAVPNQCDPRRVADRRAGFRRVALVRPDWF